MSLVGRWADNLWDECCTCHYLSKTWIVPLQDMRHQHSLGMDVSIMNLKMPWTMYIQPGCIVLLPGLRQRHGRDKTYHSCHCLFGFREIFQASIRSCCCTTIIGDHWWPQVMYSKRCLPFWHSWRRQNGKNNIQRWIWHTSQLKQVSALTKYSYGNQTTKQDVKVKLCCNYSSTVHILLVFRRIGSPHTVNPKHKQFDTSFTSSNPSGQRSEIRIRCHKSNAKGCLLL